MAEGAVAISSESARKNVLLMVQTIVIHGCDEESLEFIQKEVARLGIVVEEILDVIAATHKGLADGSLKVVGVDDNLRREIQSVFSALSGGGRWLSNLELMGKPPEIVSLDEYRRQMGDDD